MDELYATLHLDVEPFIPVPIQWVRANITDLGNLFNIHFKCEKWNNGCRPVPLILRRDAFDSLTRDSLVFFLQLFSRKNVRSGEVLRLRSMGADGAAKRAQLADHLLSRDVSLPHSDSHLLEIGMLVTGPLAHPLAISLAPLTCSLALHCSALSRSTARSLTRS